MKNSNKILVGSLTVVMMGAFAVSSAFAYQGDYSKQGPDYSPERHSAMEAAMENNDYAAWSGLMADRGRITQVINAENFSRFAEAHQLAHAGDLDGADDIRAELGIRTRNGEKVGARHGDGQGEAQGEKQRMNKGEGQGNGHNRMNNCDGDCGNL